MADLCTFTRERLQVEVLYNIKEPFEDLLKTEKTRKISFTEGRNFFQSVWEVVKFVFLCVVALVLWRDWPSLNKKVSYIEAKQVQIQLADKIFRFRIGACQEDIDDIKRVLHHLIGRANNNPLTLEKKVEECFQKFLTALSQTKKTFAVEDTFTIYAHHIYHDGAMSTSEVHMLIGKKDLILGTFANQGHVPFKEMQVGFRSIYLPEDENRRFALIETGLKKIGLTEEKAREFINSGVFRQLFVDLEHNSDDQLYLIDIREGKMRLFTKLSSTAAQPKNLPEENVFPIEILEKVRGAHRIFRLEGTNNQNMFCVEIKCDV